MMRRFILLRMPKLPLPPIQSQFIMHHGPDMQLINVELTPDRFGCWVLRSPHRLPLGCFFLLRHSSSTPGLNHRPVMATHSTSPMREREMGSDGLLPHLERIVGRHCARPALGRSPSQRAGYGNVFRIRTSDTDTTTFPLPRLLPLSLPADHPPKPSTKRLLSDSPGAEVVNQTPPPSRSAASFLAGNHY